MPLPPVSQYLDASTAGGPGKFGLLELTDRLYVSAVNALTALAGGGQPGATLIPTDIARFTVVATAADSGLLPASQPGVRITVKNAAANSMNVFPATGEVINALSANTAFAVAAAKSCIFSCAVAGTWDTLLSA